MRHAKRVLEPLLLVLGLCLFVYLVHTVGVRDVAALFRRLPRWSVVVPLLYPLLFAWDVLGWKTVFPEKWKPHVSFPELFKIHLIGEALNFVTPFVDVGGEPLKILLLKKKFGIPSDAGLNTCVLSRTALWVSEMAFVFCGLLFFIIFFPVPSRWRMGLWSGAFIFIVGGTVLVVFLRSWKRFDFKNKAFLRSACFHFAGWLSGAVEMFAIFRLVGFPVSPFEALVFEAMLQFVRLASFFVPANLGIQEAGLALLVKTLGYPPAAGVAASLLKRARQLIWTAVGFALWGVYKLTFKNTEPAA